MKPSTALTMIESLTVALGAAERRSDELRSTRLDILARLDRGEDLSAVGQIAADAIGAAVFDATFAESDEPAQPKPDDAPYGRRSDGTPKARPGRKAKEAPAVDEAKNAAELRAIRSALEGGPITVGELVMNSGVSHPDVMRHLAAGAVIEEYTAARGEGLEPLPLVRLISQRTS